MSDTNSQGEPTMEEILASIRRIISEDGSEEEAAEPEAPEAEEPAPEPEAEAEEAGGDVLDLTQMVGEDGSVVDLAKERENAAAAEGAEPEEEPEPPEEEPELDVDLQEPAAEAGEPEVRPEEGGLISDPTKLAAMSSFVELADAAVGRDDGRRPSIGGGLTLEELVRDALEPYLKRWLDENLATLVERIVREEIQKLVKRAEYR